MWSFDEAIISTINKNKPFGINALYQNMIYLVMALGILSVNPIEFGMQFLEKEPNQFECGGIDGKWRPCTKEEICRE